jgi:hypothetical protein
VASQGLNSEHKTGNLPRFVTSVLECRFPRRRGQIEFGAVKDPVT